MSNVYERLFKLWSMICKMVMDGVRDPQKVAEVLQAIIDEPAKIKTYLRRLEVVPLGATGGAETFESAKKVFKAGFDSDFKNWGIIFSGVAPETGIAVDEFVEDGKFRNFLGNTPEELEHRRMLGSQFVKFCREHPDKLRQDGWATFVVLTKNDEPVAADLSNVFVADARVYGDGELEAYVRKFSYDRTWPAGHRPRILYPGQQ